MRQTDQCLQCDILLTTATTRITSTIASNRFVASRPRRRRVRARLKQHLVRGIAEGYREGLSRQRRPDHCHPAVRYVLAVSQQCRPPQIDQAGAPQAASLLGAPIAEPFLGDHFAAHLHQHRRLNRLLAGEHAIETAAEFAPQSSSWFSTCRNWMCLRQLGEFGRCGQLRRDACSPHGLGSRSATHQGSRCDHHLVKPEHESSVSEAISSR
jgi:hypothetical protein